MENGVGLAALETALGMIPQPTFVIDRTGQILYANALGEALLGRDRAGVQLSLIQAAHAQPSGWAWRLTALGSRPGAAGFIAVLDPGVRRWNLTARQTEVLDLVADGATNAAVAEALGITERTVEFHLSAIYDKAGVDNRATLIARLRFSG